MPQLISSVVLVHGCHLQAVGWEQMVWGDGEKIGRAPFGLVIARELFAQKIVFGTGASEKDGLKESEYTYRFLEQNLHRLGEFKEWPHLNPVSEVRGWLEHLVVIDAQTKNIVEEIKNALAVCRSVGARQLMLISSPAHMPRCLNTAMQIDTGGVRVVAVPSASSAGNYTPVNTVIVESPHRGDDPMVDAPIKMHQIIPRIFKLPLPERIKFLQVLDTILTDHSV